MAAGQQRSGDSAEPEIAGLIGCGVMAGLGAAMNTGGYTWRQRCCLGLRGVGDAAIEGSRIAGAHTIIAIDQMTSKWIRFWRHTRNQLRWYEY